jgi:hypothetical protein
MKQLFTILFLMTVLPVSLISCSAIEGIFKAGVWSGVIMVVGVIVLIGVIFYSLFKNRD